MKVEVRRSKKEELPPFSVIIAFRDFRGIVGAEKVFYEGKEVQEDRDFNNIFKIEIIEEWGLKREDDFLYSPSLYVYLWEDTDADDIKEEIALPSKPVWRTAKAVVR
jgi:hypothetical protein